MSGIDWSLSAIPTMVDLTTAATSTHGTTPRKTFGSGAMGMWAGNTNSNTVLNYIGLNNDRQVILNAVGATTPNLNLTSVYNRADVNLNGTVNYIGLNNDRQLLLNNVGATTPNLTRTQQLP